MSDDPRIGLRDEDLTPDERTTWSDDRARRPELAAAHADALALAAAVRTLPDVPARTTTHTRAAPLLVLASVIVLLVVAVPWASTPTALRPRGSGGATTDLHLRAVAEGPRGARVVVDGGTVAPDERVVFEVESSRAGTVTIDELGPAHARVWPPTDRWDVAPGRTLVGGDRPAAWRSDATGRRTYVAEWCDPAGVCTRTDLTLTWSPR